MKRGSGDLCALPGRLYTRRFPARLETKDAASSSTSEQNDLEHHGDSADTGSWQPLLSSAAFKITSDAPAAVQVGRGRYGISVENKSPLNSNESKAEERLNFPIDIAMDANLVTMGDLALPLSDPAYGLGLDSIVLLWCGSPYASPCGPVREDHEDLVGWTIPEEDGLPPAADVTPDVSDTYYAFAFDIARDRVEAGIHDLALTFTPLDALYLARLCAYDDTMRSQDGSLPSHLCTSDEILAELLMKDGVVGNTCLPTQPQSTPGGVHTKSC